MAVTKTVTHSYGSRVGNAFKGVVGGFIAVVAGICLLWWNEGRTVKRQRTLDQGRKDVVEAKYDEVDSSLEGKLVHVSGSATTDEVLEDDEFKFAVNAFQLSRKVEMYQWVEHEEHETKEKLGGSEEETITYTYKKEWREDIVDSSSFEESGHDNPPEMPFEAGVIYASEASFGDYSLNKDQIQRVGTPTELAPAKSTWVQEQIKKLTDAGNENVKASDLGNVCGIPRMEIRGKTFYRPVKSGDNTAQVGDVRVSFFYVGPKQDISIIAQQTGSSFQTYMTKNGPLDELRGGIMGAEEIFQAAESENKVMAWILRLFGFILIGMGFSAIFKPLPTLMAVVPFLGKIVGAGVGLIAWTLAAVVSLIVIAIAWLAYRPILAIVLIAAAVGLVILVKKMKGPATEVAAAAAGPAPAPEPAPAPAAADDKQA